MERKIQAVWLALLVACGGGVSSDPGGGGGVDTAGGEIPDGTGGAATGGATGGRVTGGVTTGGAATGGTPQTGGVATGGHGVAGSDVVCISGTTSPVACPGGVDGFRICQYTGEWGSTQCPDAGGSGGEGGNYEAVEAGRGGAEPIWPCVYRCVTVTRQYGEPDIRTVIDTTFDPCVPVSAQNTCTQGSGYSVSQQCALAEELVETDCEPGPLGTGGSGSGGTGGTATGGSVTGGVSAGGDGTGGQPPRVYGTWSSDGLCATLTVSDCVIDYEAGEACGECVTMVGGEHRPPGELGYCLIDPATVATSCNQHWRNCDGIDSNGCEVYVSDQFTEADCETALRDDTDAMVTMRSGSTYPVCR